ncbi:MAG: DUF86 domain-containing protein [Desulfobacterales bacterium]|nr:DUF86 domain-containing protein [Desulfobacterales bacterium]
MYDRELALEILEQIHQATQTILKRFKPIKSCDDFTNSDWGMEKLDSICMQLIAIGENLKNFDKVTNHYVLTNYPQIEWKKVKGMRDIITHHYFDLNAEAIYDVCVNHVEQMAVVIKKIINEIKS